MDSAPSKTKFPIGFQVNHHQNETSPSKVKSNKQQQNEGDLNSNKQQQESASNRFNQSAYNRQQQNQESKQKNNENEVPQNLGNSRKPTIRLDEIEVDWKKQKDQVQIMIDGIEIYFPFEPYPQQREYMSKVIQALDRKTNALLQSPTGTGKTLCLLCATLGWLKKKRANSISIGDKSVPIRIIYSSRTHGQLQQVVKELKTTVYKPKMTVLASRDQYCLKKDFELLSGGQRIGACQKAIKGDDPMVSCKFYRGHHEEQQEEFINSIMDIEDLKVTGNCNQFCPYFYSRRYKDLVDILFLPYNYLLDSSNLGSFNVELSNAILIFDEAHNVHKVSEDSSSLCLSTFHLDSIEKEIQKLRQLMGNFQNPQDFKKLSEKTKNRIKKLENDQQGISSNESICYALLSVTKSLKLWMMKEMEGKTQSSTEVFEGRRIFHILSENGKYNPKIDEKFLQGSRASSSVQLGYGYGWRESELQKQQIRDFNPFSNGLDASNIDTYLNYLSKALEDLQTTQNYGLDQLFAFLKLVKSLMVSSSTKLNDKTPKASWVDFPINNYKLLVDFNLEKSELSLFLQCLDPSQSFSVLKEKNPFNMIFTSGTLSPFSSWSAELKMPFPIQLSNSHVINTEKNLLAGIISKGPSGKDLSFDYYNRGNTQVIDDLGISILNLVKFIPNGVLIIFNSFSSFEICKQRWTFGEQRIMKQLQDIKNILIEPTNSQELASIMEKYTQQARSVKGAILFAVCRGKISEGIDFSDELARAVFVIGIPYPPTKQTKVTNKRDHLDLIWQDESISREKISGRDWYLQQAIRAVNQVRE